MKGSLRRTTAGPAGAGPAAAALAAVAACGLLLLHLSAAPLGAAVAWTDHLTTAPPEPALPPPAGPVSPARKYFSDVELVDQNGQSHRLYSDLLQGKVVVVDAFFTTCTGACPVLGQKMAALQEWLGGRLGKDVYLLSFTVDPQTDTPAKLKEYAQQLGAKPGWYFLTGKKENVDWALYKLGHYVEQKQDHTNLLIIGNEPTGLWKKVFGLAQSEDLIHSLDAVLHDRG